ncbi:hypothetical protein LUTEI9C_150031 [Luteimonas sp. 9C]|nr:hypothetical protein LUTEI9C_150031 [Luteimonas sp. 9C]
MHVVRHQLGGDRPEQRGRDDPRHDDALVQRAHDRAAGLHLDEEGADDRGQDGGAAEHQRIQHAIGTDGRCHQEAEQHRRDHGDRVGFEQIGRHARAVADVVTHVVGDHRRVARVVFGNAGFDLAHQIRADIRALGEDAAAQAREDRDQRAAEGQAHQCVQRVLAGDAETRQQHPVTGHAQQAEADDQHAGDRAAAERDVHGRTDAAACGLGRADVGLHRHVHADVARRARQHRAEQEADAGGPPQEHTDEDEQHRADDGDRQILSIEIRAGAFLDRACDVLHPCVPGRLPVDPAGGDHAVENRDGGTAQCQPQPVLLEHGNPSQSRYAKTDSGDAVMRADYRTARGDRHAGRVAGPSPGRRHLGCRLGVRRVRRVRVVRVCASSRACERAPHGPDARRRFMRARTRAVAPRARRGMG